MKLIIVILPVSLLIGSCCGFPLVNCYHVYKYQNQEDLYIHNFIINDSIIVMMEGKLFEISPEERSNMVKATILLNIGLYNDSSLPMNFKSSNLNSRLIFDRKIVEMESITPWIDTVLFSNPKIRNMEFYATYLLDRRDNFFKQKELLFDCNGIKLDEISLSTTPAILKLNKERGQN